jgi:hypothetical protein
VYFSNLVVQYIHISTGIKKKKFSTKYLLACPVLPTVGLYRMLSSRVTTEITKKGKAISVTGREGP